jgi:hypothetical protein
LEDLPALRLAEQAGGRWMARAVASACVVVAVLYGVAWLVGYGTRPWREIGVGIECGRNMHAMVRGMNLYSDDFGGRYMRTEHWEDLVRPYVPVRYHRCPTVGETAASGSGYAANADLSGANRSRLARPESSVVLYDSARIGRNVADAVASLPSPGRHVARRAGEQGFVRANWIAYADGRSRRKTDAVPR